MTAPGVRVARGVTAKCWLDLSAVEQRQGLTLVHVRAQFEQFQDTFGVKLGYTMHRRAQVELKSEQV